LKADLELASRESFPVKGLPAALEADDLIVFWRNVWGDFANALKAWPEIRETATKIVNTM